MVLKIMKKLAGEITQFQNELKRREPKQAGQKISREAFTLLLSGISTCRKAPGILGHMGYESLYHCINEDAAGQTRKHLADLYGIHDRESLENAFVREFSDGNRYEYFMTFWSGAPVFDPQELHPEARDIFLEGMEQAKPFYPLVKEKGFYAWDINEKIGLCRKAAACGILTEEEFWEVTDPWVRQAQVFYHSWEEYAVSCLCGAVYFMRCPDMKELEDFLHLNMKLMRQLLSEDGAWGKNCWYTPKEKEWAELFEPEVLCLATKKVLEENRIGYMYKEMPAEDFLDSGWRFLAGDEPEEYIADPENISIVPFSDLCNIDPTVLAYFNAECGREFEKREDGWTEI